MLIFIIQIVRD